MNWFYNLSIAKKIKYGFLLVISFSIILGVYSVFSFREMSQETQKMFDNPYTSVKSILTIKTNITKIHSLMQEVAVSSDIADITRIANEIDQYESDVFQEFKVFGNSYDGDMQAFQKLKLAFIDSKPIRDEILHLSLASMRDVATKITNNQGVQSVNQLNETIDVLLNYSQQSAEQFVYLAKKSSRVGLLTHSLALVLLLIASLTISRITAKSIVKPIKKIGVAAASLSKGQLNATMSAFHNDEVGELAASITDTISILNNYVSEISYILTEMAKGNMRVTVTSAFQGNFLPIKNALDEISKSLNSTLHSIHTAAGAVAHSAANLHDQAFLLAQSVEKQVNDTNQLRSYMNNISVQSKQNQANAQDANTFAHQIKQSAENGSEKMQNMLCAMSDMSQSSHDIDKIVKVIEDIAFQTTILSLNASIESATAGEHGKGFAVVAAQVRELANRSSSAAAQARNLVTNSIEKTDQGSKAANETAAALADIIGGIDNAATLIDSIFQSSNQQSALVEGVVEVVNHIHGEVEQNDRSAKQSAHESELLTGQAVLLKGKIDHFELGGE